MPARPPTVANGAKAATPGAAANKRLPSAVMPNTHQIAAETGGLREPTTQIPGRPASDFMVDVIKSLKIEYIYSNPASSFRGLHESLINYGKNTMPEFLTVTHEEASVAMCHGHFKATGKPQMALMHGTVGLQHAAMAVYNAWADRVPLIMIGGNDLDASKRPPGVPTVHSAQDINALVRDFTKWDDQPVSLQHFAQSFVRAYKYAMTPPYGPVMIALDAGAAAGARSSPTRRTSTRRDTFRRHRRTPTRTRCVRPPSSWSMRRTRSSSPTAARARRRASTRWSSSPS